MTDPSHPERLRDSEEAIAARFWLNTHPGDPPTPLSAEDEKMIRDYLDPSKPLDVIMARIFATLDALRAALASESSPGLDDAYTLLVSAIPALYRAWNQSPNDTADRLNALLYAKVTEWVTAYQRETGRRVDSYQLATKEAEPFA